MGAVDNIAFYYRSIIEYANLAEIKIPLEKDSKYPPNGFPLTTHALKKGVIDETTKSKLFKKGDKHFVDVTIAISSFVFYPPSFRAFLWLPAKVDKEGKLHIPDRPFFVIPKCYFDPYSTNISLGMSWDKFLKTQEGVSLTDIHTWEEYIAKILHIKEEVAPDVKIEYSKKTITIKESKKHYIFKGNLVSRMHGHIIASYTAVEKTSDSQCKLFKFISEAMLSGCNAVKKVKLISLTSMFSGSLPIGGKSYTPNLEQWKAIESTLECKDGELVAVQGPPGTGKTSMLKFIIASTVVNSVLKGNKFPEIMTLCSMNNQAVTNAVKSLEIDKDIRWLDVPIGIGTYFPSAKVKLENSPAYVLINKSDKGSYSIKLNGMDEESLFNKECFFQVRTKFMEKACKDLKIKLDSDIREIQYRLKSKLRLSKRKLFISNILIKLADIIPSIFSSNQSILKNLLQGSDNYYSSMKNKQWEKREKLLRQNFIYALHYWETRFIEEIDRISSCESDAEEILFKTQEEGFKVLSLLTPFFGMTLHQCAKYFGPKTNPKMLMNFIDLLIIDESGQVTPEIGSFVFALAKKALVVGDCKQIEPIQNVSEDQDSKIHKGLHVPVEASSSRGSIMALAEYCTSKQITLLEHFRCHSKIIEISNRLCYDGNLIPIKNEGKSLYPPVSYVDIYGECQRFNGASLRNDFEAEVIAEWLKINQQDMKKYYKKEIRDIVAVVTPFNKQAVCISEKLKEKGVGDITVGTVHKIQGAEFPVVLFSPVYSMKYLRENTLPKNGKMFFDVSTSMVNVAVSRAQDSFMYFGDPRILQSFSGKNSLLPSEVLSECLNKSTVLRSAQEIVGDMGRIKVDSERLTKLEEHRENLAQAFSDAQMRIVISSPFITYAAIQYDNIVQLIEQARDRGVEVSIYYDKFLNQKKNDEIRICVEMLEKAGARIIEKKRLHSKVLFIDNKMIIEGSFNWLSAVRNKKSDYHRYESSIVYRGDSAAAMIHDAENELKQAV